MKHVVIFLFAVSLITSLSNTAQATASVPAIIGKNKNTEARPYVGLKWMLGGGYKPMLVAGLTVAEVSSNGSTQGIDLSTHISFEKMSMPSLVKLNYINGSNNTQGAVGFGYNFMLSKPLFDIGLNAPFANVAFDAYLDKTTESSITLKTLGSLRKPSSTIECPDGYSFISATRCAN